MKNLALLALLASVALIGCSKSESDLSASDKQAMDKLFREGIKNPPSNAASGKEAEQKPINAPVDN